MRAAPGFEISTTSITRSRSVFFNLSALLFHDYPLDYEALVKKRITQEVEIPDETLDDGGGIEPHGTKIIMSRLVYEPMKSGLSTIANAIGDHFSLINQGDFYITLNAEPVAATPREFVYAYPMPGIAPTKLVKHQYTTDDGRTVTFQYRLRFTGKKTAFGCS